jgi:hypothetical protein
MPKKPQTAFQAKIGKVMKEGKEGNLHSGSKKGPVVTNPKQKIAIALSEARKATGQDPYAQAKAAARKRS